MLGFIFLPATGIAAFYLATACRRLIAFSRRPLTLSSEFLPSFTVLKPIAGLEPDLQENLASFCDQDYPGFYEVVFCLRAENDPALEVVERIMREFPNCHAQIALGENADLMNPKIANIAKPGVAARSDVIVIADSDIRVGRDYLRALASSFEGAKVGAVTCLYSGSPNDTIASRLGALGIDDGFAPSVLVALVIGELRFCLGATMAVRRSVLEALGGLAALGHTFADDHELGQLVTKHGYGVELSRYVVTTTIAETRVFGLLSHELRLARNDFEIARGGYLFSFLVYGLPLALVYLAVTLDTAIGLPLLAAIVLLRVALHYLARYALGVKSRDDVLLIPLRDFLSLGVWAASIFGRRRSFR
ncbi:MAG TPA: bacteriohopanetetrol glucosamine biosynthesis glycosyltransferase HpnI [Candidatus Cybelea sp.]|nr:bacteriohopanetetrol glucosamine biosynthesis glycosyltransferase HpnI [Candidatus Cybelea sp.]